MTTIYYESDADLGALDGQRVAVVGYGNQGRSWALNLRDSGCAPIVCVRRDDTREQAEADGFEAHDLEAANDADVICILVPDDVIALLPLAPRADSCVIVASGYTLGFGRLDPPGDSGMVAPRMLGPEVRRCYEEGVGFITAVGVHHDATGHGARPRARGRQGDRRSAPGRRSRSRRCRRRCSTSASSRCSHPRSTAVNNAFVQTMIEHDIPIEAIVVELVLSGEVERTYRLLREVGYAVQSEFHSPTSQYGQLTRRGRYDHLDFAATMRGLADDIESGRFADEWDAERDAGYPTLTRLKEQHAGPAVREYEAELRRRLGPNAVDCS